MFSDLRIACRGLRRSPAFTLAAIGTLALGIGANTTMFSVVNAVLLRPLPGYETNRLVQICDGSHGSCKFVAPEIYLRLRERLQSFAPVAANQFCRMNLTGRGEPEQILGPCTTANWFELQRAQAMLGRTFLPGEDQYGRNRVVVLDHGYWQRRFGGDPKIAGQALILDKEPWLVVGVMPAQFRPIDTRDAAFYTPYVVADNPHGLKVTARLKPGVTLAAAQTELNVAADQLARENAEWKGLKLLASPVLEQMTGPNRTLLLLLLGAVSFVLLIACANAANLLLARSAARQREIAVRLALGASRGHIVRFVMAEALMLATVASVLSIGIAYGGLRALKPLAASLPRVDEWSIDGRVLACTLLLGGVSAMVFGALPAIRSSNSVALRARPTSRSQAILVAAEVALAFVLLLGTGLLLRTFAAIRAKDLGYNTKNVLAHFVGLPPSPDGTRSAGVATFARIREEVAALPGVRAVATGSSVPSFGVSASMPVNPEGQPERRDGQTASLVVVSEDYFRVLEIPRLAGRWFIPADREGSTRVAVVSLSIARRHFAGNAIDGRIILPEFLFNIDGGPDGKVAIVGVVGNACVNSAEDCDAEHIYLPESQSALRMENLLVRTAGPPWPSRARHAVYVAAPTIPLDDPKTLEERASYLSDERKRAMWLLGVFAGLAIVLAAAGIYGISAYLATQRSREIGIRMVLALGAQFADIASLVYRGTLLPSAAGLAVGALGGVWLARLLKSVIFGVTAGDSRTLAITAVTLLATAALAATGPAVRAALSEPAKVLRRD